MSVENGTFSEVFPELEILIFAAPPWRIAELEIPAPWVFESKNSILDVGIAFDVYGPR